MECYLTIMANKFISAQDGTGLMEEEEPSRLEAEAAALRRIFGDRLKRARKEQGYTQDAFAQVVGLTKNHLSALERGKVFARPEKMLEFSSILGIEFNISARAAMEELKAPAPEAREPDGFS